MRGSDSGTDSDPKNLGGPLPGDTGLPGCEPGSRVGSDDGRGACDDLL